MARRLNKKTTDVVAGKCLDKGVRFINSTSGNKGPPSNSSQSSEFKKTHHFVPLKYRCFYYSRFQSCKKSERNHCFLNPVMFVFFQIRFS